MGYHTDFSGSFALDRPLTPEHAAYLKAFNETRRMGRDPQAVEKLDDPTRVAAGLPIGEQGAYYVGGLEDGEWDGQLKKWLSRRDGILDVNRPPLGQPGLWCQWVPGNSEWNEDGPMDEIRWDDGEKFYEYVPWIEYLIEHFLKPWGYVLNGDVEWQGEERDDRGMIRITDNEVKALAGRVVYEEDA